MDAKLWALFGGIFYLWAQKKIEQKVEADKWREEVPINGTDFQGAIWDRLDGTDLLNARWADQNLDNSGPADPGRIGQANLGLQPAWNGNL
ncbi:hypothetical protein [Simplicispira suum]|uniref:Uncharacterized protein n=1 Tax=Simplicispira suum TaxID=2109915 RepID=A0A2S0N461_9BURK|nr:hypothetical protein [Simplicispira suum]AVO42723.1 hypothetical protein C6571_16755 [Simplicispira suum]